LPPSTVCINLSSLQISTHKNKLLWWNIHREEFGTIEFRRVGTMRMLGKKEYSKLQNGVNGVGFCDAGGGIVRIAKLPILLSY